MLEEAILVFSPSTLQQSDSSVRRGFTMLEVTITLTLLALAVTLVAEVGCWSLRERAQGALRQDALELAANVLEAARARPWEDLTAEWASTQRLPESLAQRFQDGKLSVRVAPEPSGVQTKRVTVVVEWNLDSGITARPVQLVGLFSARSARLAGGNP